MTPGNQTRGWSVTFLVAVVLATALLSVGQGTAHAGKPPPPPPPSSQRIYFGLGDGYWHSMDMAGGSKATLPSSLGIGLSRAPHGGAYLSVSLRPNPGNGTTPAPCLEALPDLVVQPVNSTASTVVVPGGRFQLTQTQASFLPGDDAALVFTAVEWDAGTVLRAGFYLVTLAYDGNGAVTGATSPQLLFTVPWEIRNLQRGPTVDMGCKQRFDWADDRTVLWSLRGGTWGSHILRTTVPESPADYTTCSTDIDGGEETWGPVAVSPSRSRVTFGSYAGLVEVDVAGGNRSVWVASTMSGGSRARKAYTAGGACYADDNTIVYTYRILDYNKMVSTYDVYRISRGGSGVNLTGDTSASATTDACAVR